jgi:hypothetical protein
MPTRTVRHQATTFLGKLSKHNAFRKKMSHKDLDGHLKKLKGIVVPKNATAAVKTEYLAAANFLTYHGRDEERLLALSDGELQTLNTMLGYPAESDRDTIVAQLLDFTENFPHTSDFSADSSGTDQARDDDQNGGLHKTPDKTKSDAPKSSARHKTASKPEEDSESFSSDSDEEEEASFLDDGPRRSSRTTRGKRARHLESSSDDDAGSHSIDKARTSRGRRLKSAPAAAAAKDSRLVNFDLTRIGHRRPPLKDIVAADPRFANCDLDALRRACLPRPAGKAGADKRRQRQEKGAGSKRGQKASSASEPSSSSDESSSASSDDSASSVDSADSTHKKGHQQGTHARNVGVAYSRDTQPMPQVHGAQNARFRYRR